MICLRVARLFQTDNNTFSRTATRSPQRSQRPVLASFKVEFIPSSIGGGRLRMTPVNAGDTVTLEGGHEVQQAYLLTYRSLPAGIVKKERF
jgi:hypothetical protein